MDSSPTRVQRFSSVVALILAVLFYGSAHSADSASDPSHRANVEELLVLMGVPEQVNNNAAKVVDLYAAKVTSDDVEGNVKELIEAYQKDLETIVDKVLGWDSLKTTYIGSYAARFSKDEVSEITNFMSSSTGRRFVETQFEIGTEIRQTTDHLVEADLSPLLKYLSGRLNEGLEKTNMLKKKEQQESALQEQNN